MAHLPKFRVRRAKGRHETGRYEVYRWGRIRMGGQTVAGWEYACSRTSWRSAMALALDEPDYDPYPMAQVWHPTVWESLHGGVVYQCIGEWPGGERCTKRSAIPFLYEQCSRLVPARLVGA